MAHIKLNLLLRYFSFAAPLEAEVKVMRLACLSSHMTCINYMPNGPLTEHETGAFFKPDTTT